MAGKILTKLFLCFQVRDKVQVYMFTGTGLQDKQNNHLTQFVGLFLRPKDFMKEPGPCPYALTNGEIGGVHCIFSLVKTQAIILQTLEGGLQKDLLQE